MVAEKTGCATLLAEKAPAGMGTPRPKFAKLRVPLESHFCCAKIAQWSGPRMPEAKNLKYVFYIQKILFWWQANPRWANFAGGKTLRAGEASPRTCLAKGFPWRGTFAERKLPSGRGRGQRCISNKKIAFLLPKQYVSFRKNVPCAKEN